ncbi:MAG: DUF2252 family protein [Bacteroidetes bacterium]|nr:DUF2252 family protein [Bacteroidota bacterium]
MKDAVKLIVAYNKNLSPERRRQKYRALQESILRFYRGTCHLFYDRLHTIGTPQDDTRIWICGDLHLENFGSFRGDDSLVYFDVNDFDEAVKAPLSWEVARFVTAIIISRQALGYDRKESLKMARLALGHYAESIAGMKALIVQRDSARGLMADFFEQATDRSRADFIDNVTKTDGRRRKFNLDGVHLEPLDRKQHERLMKKLPDMLAATPHMAQWPFRVEDCCLRLAGTGSIGVERYAILIMRKDTDKHYILDMKQARASSLLSNLKTRQPKWRNEAERIICIQRLMQFFPPALLDYVHMGGKDFVLKELQPVRNKMDFALFAGRPEHMEDVIGTMAQIAAWTHLRSTGRLGTSTADDLAALTGTTRWQKDIYSLSVRLAAQVEEDFALFKEYRSAKED